MVCCAYCLHSVDEHTGGDDPDKAACIHPGCECSDYIGDEEFEARRHEQDGTRT
jgi:hypothetical protein